MILNLVSQILRWQHRETELLHPTPEVCSLKPDIGKFYCNSSLLLIVPIGKINIGEGFLTKKKMQKVLIGIVKVDLPDGLAGIMEKILRAVLQHFINRCHFQYHFQYSGTIK